MSNITPKQNHENAQIRQLIATASDYISDQILKHAGEDLSPKEEQEMIEGLKNRLIEEEKKIKKDNFSV